MMITFVENYHTTVLNTCYSSFCYSICGLWRMYRDFKRTIRERVVFCRRMLYTIWRHWWYVMLRTNIDNNFGICVYRRYYRDNYNDYRMLCDLSLPQQEETSKTVRWSSSSSERKGWGKTKKIDDGPFCQWRSFSNNRRNRWYDCVIIYLVLKCLTVILVST